MALASFASSPSPLIKRKPPLFKPTAQSVAAPTVPGQPDDLNSLIQTPASQAQPSVMTRSPGPAMGDSFEPQPSQMARAPGPAMGSTFRSQADIDAAAAAASQGRAAAGASAAAGQAGQAMESANANAMATASGIAARPASVPSPRMEGQQQNAVNQNASSAAGVTDLNALIGDNLTKTLQGNNPALAQAQRTAMNGMGMQQKSGQAAALRKAQSLGFAPGTPEFERVMSEAETANISAGSALMSDVAQRGFDEQNKALSTAGNFALGQQNYGLNALKRTDQVDQFGKSLGENSRQFDVGAGQQQQQITNQADQFGVTSGQNQQQITNQASQFGVNAGQNQQQITNQAGQFGQTFGAQQSQQKVQNLESIINNPLSSIAEVNAAKAQLRDINQLGPGAGAADPNNAEADLESIKQSLRVRYPTMSEAELDAKARAQYGTADDAYWKSLGMGAAIDAPPAAGGSSSASSPSYGVTVPGTGLSVGVGGGGTDALLGGIGSGAKSVLDKLRFW